MIIKHFVKNLRRQPLRLGMWLAGNQWRKLPLADTTICYSVDAEQFADLECLCDFAGHWGFDWDDVRKTPILDHYRTAPIRKNEAALRLSIDILLRHIATLPDGWYILWHDDYALADEITEYTEMLEQIGTDSDVRVILGVNIKLTWHPETRRRDIARYHHRIKRQHPEFDLFQGCAGMEGDVQIAVTPAGAKHLLSVGAPYLGQSYELTLYEYLPLDDPHIWSWNKNMDSWENRMDDQIWSMDPSQPQAWVHAWRALNNGDIFPIDFDKLKHLEDCEATWDLMHPQSTPLGIR